MGYYRVSYDDLESAYTGINRQMSSVITRLGALSNALSAMANSDSMEGKTADAIKKYLRVINGKILKGMLQLAKAHKNNFSIYKTRYRTIDSNLHFFINTEELMNIRRELRSIGNDMDENLYPAAKNAVRDVSDLVTVSLSYDKTSRTHVINIEKKVANLIEEFENIHSSNDFTSTESLYYDLWGAIRSLQKKGTGLSSFDTVNYKRTETLDDSIAALAAEQQQKSAAIKEAEAAEREYQLELEEEKGAESGSTTDFESTTDFGDATDWLSHLFGMISKKADDDDAGIIGDALGLVSSLYGMFTSDSFTVDKIGKSLTDVSKDLTGLFEDVLSDSDKDLSSSLGIASAILSVASNLIASIGKTPEEFLQESGGLISSGAKLAQKLYEECLADANFDKEAAGNDVAAIAAIFTMGTRAVGDVISYSEDGSYDLNDYSNTLLETGLSGASSLIKTCTFGLVSFDVDDTADVFHDNIDSASAMIHSWGLPTGVEAVVDVLASPIVAIKSSYDVVAGNDTVQDVISGVKDGISVIGDSLSKTFTEGKDPINSVNDELRSTTGSGKIVIFNLGGK